MQIHETVFIAPGAVVLGDVTIGKNSGFGTMRWSGGTEILSSSEKRVIFRTMRSCIWAADIRWRSETM